VPDHKPTGLERVRHYQSQVRPSGQVNTKGGPVCDEIEATSTRAFESEVAARLDRQSKLSL
jgi:hypothetical protein